MRRFVFKLEGVLEQRKSAEQQRQRDLAEAQRQILVIEKELTAATEVEKSSAITLRGRIDPRVLATHVRFSQIMRQKLSKLREQLDAARKDLTVAHAALIEAAKQRKVLEKLQEKQQARFDEEQRRHEAAAQDDIARNMTRSDDDFPGTFPSIGS